MSQAGGGPLIVCVSGVSTNPNTKPHGSVFYLNAPWDLVSEKCVFGHLIHRIRMNGRPKRTRLMWFHQKIGCVDRA